MMKLWMMCLLGIWMVVAFTGCSDLMQSLRDDSLSASSDVDSDSSEDSYAARRNRRLNGLSANNVSSQEPPVVRQYGRRLASMGANAESGVSNTPSYSASPEYKRVTRNDFVDREQNENSLWDGQGQNNYLFSNNRKREVGDMITADVEKSLRREIQFQLWMTLPSELRRVKKNAASAAANAAGSAASDAVKSAAGAPDGKGDMDKLGKQAKSDLAGDEKSKDAAEEAAKSNITPGGKDDDTVRMEVVESLGNGLVRLVGQKRVIYRGVSRLVEVVAIVNNKDIDDNNRVKTGKFVDSQVQVLQ